VKPDSWLELLEMLFAGAWNPDLGRFRLPYAFRGHSIADEDLSSGLVRLAANRADVAKLELHLLRNFRKYAHGEVGERSIWAWLALAQHRGLPTRLLDWTYSPFVALHFATANLARMEEDGAVWAVNFVEANRRLPARLKRMLDKEGSDTATVDMLNAFSTLAEFDRLGRRQPFVIFMEPPSIDPRIINQFALFSLMSSPVARLDDWLAEEPALARDKLDQANINERVLFPGLDGLSRWLTRYYWPKPHSMASAETAQGVRSKTGTESGRRREASATRRKR
jgi:hypothetical protein